MFHVPIWSLLCKKIKATKFLLHGVINVHERHCFSLMLEKHLNKTLLRGNVVPAMMIFLKLLFMQHVS